ncbi:MAG TPA: alkaline phosphatase family protein [Opitutaceae bacterium]|nr:alkaline phosphatase family protein [Opitutaceae bacterium]
MFPALRSFLQRLNFTLLGIAICCATFWFTDHTTNRQPVAPRIVPEEVAAQRAANPRRAGVYVLILDSLRYETATNPEIMPHLVALTKDGAYAKVRPGFNSSSAAALRDAFTGRENAAVLAVVSTFLKTDAGVESIFHQLALAGRTSTAHSMGFFKQFGAGVTHEADIAYRSSREVDEANVLDAADELARGDYDFAVGHLNYTDYAAHDWGIFRPEYREAFRRADAFIPRLRARLPADATFIVMGDHGHDETGKHGFGMDVPTFTVYVGPPFRRGCDLGTINLPSHRYLMSHAAGIPLNTDGYTGRFLPQALDLRHDQLEWLKAQAQGARQAAAERTWLVWINLSLLGALWLNLAWREASPLDFSGGGALALWLALAPLLITSAWQPLIGLAALALLGWWLGRRAPPARLARWIGLPALLGLGFQAWGRVLVLARPALENLSYGALAFFWLAVAAIGAAAATRGRRAKVTWAVFAFALLLPHPTNERYGFPATIAPLLLCWLAFYAVSLWRESALRRGEGIVLASAGVGLFLLAQPFAAVGATSGVFLRWRSLLPALDVDNIPHLVLLAFLAKAVIFFPRWPGIARVLLGAALIVLLELIEGRVWVPNAYLMIGLMSAFLVAWLGLGVRLGRPEGRMARIVFWFLLYYYSVALTPRNFLEIGCLIGALVLAARIAARFPQRENIRADYLALAVLGLLVTGWAGMRWSTSELEWHTAFDWFAAPTIEHKVAFFIPWIALKCLLPWVTIATCLRDEFGPGEKFPARALLLVVAAKFMSLLMINTGLGGVDTLNRSYLEAACVTGVLAVLFPGVILIPRSWPEARESRNAQPATPHRKAAAIAAAP